MDIMDTARYNIKKHREFKGLRQQDVADKLNMNVRSYQKLENGVTRMDLERLAQIAKVLETSMEDLLKQDGIFVLQKIRETGSGSGTGNIYNNYGADKEVFDKLLATKDAEINLLKEESQSLKEEVKYLKEKIDQLMEVVGKKG
ncbi:MAG: helix-turn-helix domain-containing protein [Mangrovibacterium sp.]